LNPSGYNCRMAKRKTTPEKPAHGGARLGAGRKPLPEGSARRKRTVWLTDEEADFATSQASSLSEGVQVLIAAAQSRRKSS
jgi:hypothetical protein